MKTNRMGAAEYGESGFRFVNLELLNDVTLGLQKVFAVFVHDGTPEAGSFECDDELLSEIWRTGAYTVHLNMQNHIFDGIKRDRLVWIGDMHPEVSTICSVYGYHRCVPASLDFVKSCTPPGTWMNNIPTYSMWWIIIQRDWYMQNGDFKYLSEQKPYLLELVDFAEKQILDYCLTGDKNIFGNFVDWCSANTDYADAGVLAVFILGFKAARDIFSVFADNDMVERCDRTVRILKSKKYPYSGNKQIASLVALAGVEKADKIYDEVLSKEPLDGLSTFLGFYTLQAMAAAGEYETALDVIRGYWGAMLKMGATTFLGGF